MKAVEKVQKTLALTCRNLEDLPVMDGMATEDGGALTLMAHEGAVCVPLKNSLEAYTLARAATAVGDFLKEREVERTVKQA